MIKIIYNCTKLFNYIEITLRLTIPLDYKNTIYVLLSID